MNINGVKNRRRVSYLQTKAVMERTFSQMLAVGMFLLLTACAASKKPSDVWVDKAKLQGRSFRKVFIVGMTADVEVQVRLEKALAQGFTAEGFQVVKSIDVMPPSLDDPKKPNRDTVIANVRKTGCDAVFTATLVKAKEALNYTPGNTTFTWTGEFTGWYDMMYSTVTRPGYFTDEKSYVIQSSLFDAANGQRVLAVVSPVTNPSSLDEFTQDYVHTLVGQLQKAKVLKK